MAEALKMRDEEIRGGGNGSGGASEAIQKLGEHPRRWRQFLHEVRTEMAKVSWPSRRDVTSTTVIVLVTVAFFGFYFLVTDSLAGRFITWLINYGKTH